MGKSQFHFVVKKMDEVYSPEQILNLKQNLVVGDIYQSISIFHPKRVKTNLEKWSKN